MPENAITPLVLLVLGILLIILEVAVIPGFGVAGVMGLGLLVGGTIMVWTSYGASVGAATLFTAAAISVALIWWFFHSRASRLLVRTETITGDSSDVPSLTFLLGKQGTVLTPLRPSGAAMIDGDKYDVICEGEFLDKDTRVVVTHFTTNSIVVDRVRRSTGEEGQDV